MYMKRIICLMIGIAMMAALTGCISWPSADSVLIESDTPIGISNNPISDPDDLQYFDTPEEAIMHNDLDLQNLNLGERIKLFENDEYAALFIKENGNGDDGPSVFRFFVKESAGARSYSQPVIATRKTWDDHKLGVKRMKLDEIGEVRLWISQDSLRLYRIDEAKNFFWGFSQTERVRNLQIEGQPVTEVIEVEMNDEIAFFWYFDDLKTDKRPIFKDVRTYTEGEFIITMDG